MKNDVTKDEIDWITKNEGKYLVIERDISTIFKDMERQISEYFKKTELEPEIKLRLSQRSRIGFLKLCYNYETVKPIIIDMLSKKYINFIENNLETIYSSFTGNVSEIAINDWFRAFTLKGNDKEDELFKYIEFWTVLLPRYLHLKLESIERDELEESFFDKNNYPNYSCLARFVCEIAAKNKNYFKVKKGHLELAILYAIDSCLVLGEKINEDKLRQIVDKKIYSIKITPP